ncbi:MAG TPA: hypothetical protein VFT99_13285 [Roseiflexaceae bacterium]|nr:hypothetical protein [Roseiflexaceae bacterium]
MTTPNIAQYDLLTLASQHTTLKRKTAREYAGPCPQCGGTDRLLVQPAGGKDGRGIWTCRSCREFKWSDAIGFALWQGLAHDFRAACDVLKLDMPQVEPRTPAPVAPPACEAPNATWQARAKELSDAAFERLWSPEGQKARKWLSLDRGFTSATIMVNGIGYHDADTFDAPAAWGLPDDRAKVFTPRGITIPWVVDRAYWRVSVRRALTAVQVAAGEPKYRGPAGSGNALYRGGLDMDAHKPTVLVEGEFDALAVWQEARDLVNVCALGSTSGARRVRWIARLAACPLVLVATDHDPDPAKGEAGAHYWRQALPNARRWRPYAKDTAEMLQSGMDVRAWVQAGLEAA